MSAQPGVQASGQPGATAITVRPRGVAGEASTVYFEREFQRQAVKVLPGEFFVSGEDVVLTTLLGSCVSACIWDTRAGVGGMNHFLLPDGGSDPASESGRYGAFAMELLINELLKCGAKRNALEAKVFGGGAVLRQITTMQVGERNGRFVLQFLKDEGIRVTGQDLYDVHARRVAFLPQQGKAMVKRLPVADSRLIADEQSYRQRLVEKKPAGDVELF